MTKNEHVYAIFCRPKVACDTISTENVKTIEGYVVLNFEAAIALAVSVQIKISLPKKSFHDGGGGGGGSGHRR